MNKQRKYKIYILFIIFTLFIPNKVFAEVEEPKNLNSESAILIDATTGQILYEKNIHQQMYPASITKIVTGIIAIEQGNLNDIVTISENARYIDGTRVYLELGEKVTLLKLVKGLLINSGNDAGVAIAEHMDGSVEEFSKRMNEFVREKIGVENTTFKNPHGLYDPEHVTTAYDMALITQYAMQNETFREIVGTKNMKWTGVAWDTILYNHHQLVRQRDDVIGVKNGYVSQSGFTLVTAGQRDNIELIVVTLKSDSANFAYQDTEALLEYGFENYQTNLITVKELKSLDVDDQFEIEEDLYFTSKLNETFTTKINESGTLLVENEAGEVIYSFKLNKKPKNEEVVKSSEDGPVKQETKDESNSLQVIFIVVIGLLIVLAGILILQKRHRRKNRFFY